MATNKFATILHRNTHKIILVLVYAILEWILIFLLVLNSLISFLISKFVIYFGLKPPCTFCSRLDHILLPIKKKNIHKDIICEEHAYEISKLSYCPNHLNPILESNGGEKKESQFLETKHSSCSDEGNESYVSNSTESQIYDQDIRFKVDGGIDEVEEENTNEVFEKMEIGELVSSIITAMQDLVGVAIEEAQSPCTDSIITKADAMKESSEPQETEGEEHERPSLNSESEFEFFKGIVSSSPCGQIDQSFQEMDKIGTSNSTDISIANYIDQDLNEVDEGKFSEKLLESRNCCDGSILVELEIGDDSMTVEKLKTELKATGEALNDLYTELEEERNASAIATNQTMTMMTRLQQEKAAMEMEAQQYQRMMEEQSEYDQEALQLLNDLMVKKEREKQELEKELQIYKKLVLDYEDQEQITKIQEDSDNDDFCAYIELDLEEMGIDPVKNLSSIDESLGDFEVERLSILEELKALEMKLVTLASDDEQSFEDITSSGYHTDYPQCEDSFGFVSPKENGMIVNVVSRKLLFDENETLSEEKIESGSTNKIKCLDFKFNMVNKRVAIEEEMGHVYERLQGLETDRDFLKHCFGSLSKGDEGIDLLREILQHLRDLRTVEVRARSICDSPLS